MKNSDDLIKLARKKFHLQDADRIWRSSASYRHYSSGTHVRVKLLPDWPGNSPDLDPIENLWSQMKDMQQDKRETSKDGLKKIALTVWKKVTPQYVQNLYESMPRRMAAVIESQGGHTKY